VPIITTAGSIGAATRGKFWSSHTYGTNNPAGGPYAVTAEIADDDGGTFQFSTPVLVTNVPPELTTPTRLFGTAGVPLMISGLGSFTDPGWLDQWTYSIYWDDATADLTQIPTMHQAGGPGVPAQGSFDAMHTYLQPGYYVASVVLYDDVDVVNKSVEIIIAAPEFPLALPPTPPPPPVSIEEVLDIAYNNATGRLWVATNGRIVDVDPVTGQWIANIVPLPQALPMTAAGLAVAPAMSFAGVNVPAGTLLLAAQGGLSDRVFAVDPSNGSVLASLDLGSSLEPVGVAVLKGAMQLAILGTANDRLIIVDANTAAKISEYAVPHGLGPEGDLEVDAVTGDILVASSSRKSLVMIDPQSGPLADDFDFGGTMPAGICGLSWGPNRQLFAATVANSLWWSYLPADPAGSQPDAGEQDSGVGEDQGDGGTGRTRAIANGTFITSQDAPDFGWSLRGRVTVEQQAAILWEDDVMLTRLWQSIVIPPGALTLEFDLFDTRLEHTLGQPPDTFEFALLEAASGRSLLDPVRELTGTDAVLNVQADGQVFVGSQVHVAGLMNSGDILSLEQPLTVTVNLQAVPPGTQAVLYFDLLSFGGVSSHVTLDNVFILVPTHEPPVAQHDVVDTAIDSAVAAPVLNNDYDPDSDLNIASLQFTSLPEHGTVVLDQQHAYVLYTPDPGFAGSDTFDYTITDETGLVSAPATVTIRVQGPPVIRSLVATQPASEGGLVNFQADAVDPNGDVMTYHWEFGDGTAPLTTTTGQLTHRFRDDGVYPVTLTVSDAYGYQADAVIEVTVDNSPPTVDGGEDRRVRVGASVELWAAYTDAGVLDTHSALVIWDDGTNDEATVLPHRERVWASHMFLAPGDYQVRLAVTDNGGMSRTDEITVSVYDVLPFEIALDPACDSGTPADQLTNVGLVRLTGLAEPLSEVQLDIHGDGSLDMTTWSDSLGQFVFADVPLVQGDNLCVAYGVSDGQLVSQTLTVNLDQQPPWATLELPAAGSVAGGDAGYIEMQWFDPGTAGCDDATFGPSDITVTGVTIDRIEIVGDHRVRYYYADDGDVLTTSSVLVTQVAGEVADRAANWNSTRTDTFTMAASSLSGHVYLDVNNNGIMDPVELRLPNVPITIVGPTIRTVLTDETGYYEFTGLPPGTYSLIEAQPAAFLDGTDRTGTPGVGFMGNDCWDHMELTGSMHLTNYDFGERGLRPELISKALFLASTPPSGSLVATYSVPNDYGWLTFTPNRDGIVSLAVVNAGEPAIELYTDDFMPQAITTGHWLLNAKVRDGQSYIVHVAGSADVLQFAMSLTNDTGQAFAPHENGVFTNQMLPRDVNADGLVTPIDALLVINELNRAGSHYLLGPYAAAPFLDVVSDGYVSPIDALVVINYLNAGLGGHGEGEAADLQTAAIEPTDSGWQAALENADCLLPTMQDCGTWRERRFVTQAENIGSLQRSPNGLENTASPWITGRVTEASGNPLGTSRVRHSDPSEIYTDSLGEDLEELLSEIAEDVAHVGSFRRH